MSAAKVTPPKKGPVAPGVRLDRQVLPWLLRTLQKRWRVLKSRLRGEALAH